MNSRWPSACGLCGENPARWPVVRGWSKWVHGTRRITVCNADLPGMPSCWTLNRDRLAAVAGFGRSGE